MRLQSIMYISLIVVADPRYHHQAIQSILCCAYITIWIVIFITNVTITKHRIAAMMAITGLTCVKHWLGSYRRWGLRNPSSMVLEAVGMSCCCASPASRLTYPPYCCQFHALIREGLSFNLLTYWLERLRFKTLPELPGAKTDKLEWESWQENYFRKTCSRWKRSNLGLYLVTESWSEAGKVRLAWRVR
jgi:hypothetical protein